MNPFPPSLSASSSGVTCAIACAIGLFTAGAPTAYSQLVTKASEDFQWQYTATVLPNAATPSWILRTAGSSVSASISSSVLHIDSPSASTAGNHLYYEARTVDWRDSFQGTVGFTVEMKVRVETGYTFGVNLGFNEGDLRGAGRAALLRIDDSGTAWQTGNGSNVTYQTIDTTANDDGFHIFRLVKLPGTTTASGAFNIYRDGILIAENVAGSNDNLEGLDRFFFGGLGASLGEDVKAEVEWVRWDATGAYSPIPEPGTVAFLGAGCMLMLAGKKFLRKSGR